MSQQADIAAAATQDEMASIGGSITAQDISSLAKVLSVLTQLQQIYQDQQMMDPAMMQGQQQMMDPAMMQGQQQMMDPAMMQQQQQQQQPPMGPPPQGMMAPGPGPAVQ
jgi:hypothetical protein